jgi:diaminopimelate epimerase
MAFNKNLTGEFNSPVKVLGGDLNIRFNFDGQKFTNIFLEGPATRVFEGDFTV